MNRQRVIFVKEISNDEVKTLSRKYPNAIFFTNDNENEQIWNKGGKVSGITRIDKSKNVSIYNYQYSNINHYIALNPKEAFAQHDIYSSNFMLRLNYNPSIDEMINHDSIQVYIDGKSLQNIKRVVWSIDSKIFTLGPINNNNQLNVVLNYNPTHLIPDSLTRLSALITDKYGVTHNIYANVDIKNGEIIPYPKFSNQSSILVSLSVEKTHIAIDESISILPVLTYTTLDYKNILPSMNILSEHWSIDNTKSAKISNDGILTGIYSDEFESNKSIPIKVKYNLNIEGYPELEQTITINIYKKYIYFENSFNDQIVIKAYNEYENVSLADFTPNVHHNNQAQTNIPNVDPHESIGINDNVNPHESIGINDNIDGPSSEITDIFEEP